MEIIGFEKDEKVLAKAEKSGGRVLWVIVCKVIFLILWFAVINPLLFQWMVSQYSISYESLGDLIASVVTQKAAGYVFGIFFWVTDVLFALDAIMTVIFAFVRHTRRELYLTDRRIFGHTGNLLLGKREFNLSLSQITGISVREDRITRLFRYGIIDIDTALGRYSVDGIGDPYAFLQAFKGKIVSQVSNEKREETERLQAYKKKPEEIEQEYRTILEESGSHYQELTGDPVLEKRERYYIGAAASMYMLLCILGATTLLSWAIVPIQVGAVLGLAFSLFIGVMGIKRKLWAFRVMQVMLILGMVVDGIAFIGALPTLAALSYLGLVGYMIVTFCLINAGSAALSDMVQSARRRPKVQPKWSANR